jgi:hypothetical protein
MARTAPAMLRQLAGAVALALVACLLVLTSGALTERAEAQDTSQYGRTIAKNGVLKKGCRTYRYGYDIKPPDEGYWTLETFIIGPKGKRLFSGAFIEGFDETTGTDTYRICRPTTRAGVFKIRAKLTSGGETNETFEVWLPVTKFRLRNPR